MKEQEPQRKFPKTQNKVIKNEVRFIQRRHNMKRIGRTGK